MRMSVRRGGAGGSPEGPGALRERTVIRFPGVQRSKRALRSGTSDCGLPLFLRKLLPLQPTVCFLSQRHVRKPDLLICFTISFPISIVNVYVIFFLTSTRKDNLNIPPGCGNRTHDTESQYVLLDFSLLLHWLLIYCKTLANFYSTKCCKCCFMCSITTMNDLRDVTAHRPPKK